MSRHPDKTNTAAAIITEYLRDLYGKKIRGEPLTPEERKSVSTQAALAEYVFTQEKVKITETTPAAKGKKKKSAPNEMSIDLVKKVIKLLLDNRILEKKDGILQYVPTLEEQSEQHPILKVASDITITPLNVTELAFFRVPPEHAKLIVRYLNAQFYSDDIYSTALGDIIMCMDLQVPKKAAAIAKRHPMDVRVRQALSLFNWQETMLFDEKQGYTAKQLKRLNERQAAKQARIAYKEALKLEASYDGKPLHRVRNIKKRNTPKSTSEN